MHLVLTHEQADFDAVASLLAVRLMDPGATAVLPRRLNRNVRAFLTLYGDRLPLVEFDDLRRGPIERITLADTQNLVSVKGYRAGVPVHVVDHHPRTAALPENWTAHIEPLGATTTLLVEDIQQLGLELDLVQATMLLLGIYEDTGSLTYGSTTPRDIRACAWLIEAGANLQIAADFLNHPLSESQRALYDRLFEAATTHEIQGLTIVITAAEAPGFLDEISTLAHKLRDLFDPDGLFVLVGLNGHVQMVARSTTDSLDVAKVAEHFGGGGHNRAAAAIIRDASLDSVRRRLLELLPQVIEPEITVGEIMSRGPQLLDPQVTITQAAEQMRRFGHEGYPVVENGKVIGLLTRRAVDRALAHGLDKMPVSSVMNAGELVVSPHDSVQHLQRLMIEHDWGQVPVADPESGEIIGIVTRTDLLKTLAGGQDRPRRASLADKLDQALPPARREMLRLIARQAEELGLALYVVGGFVRDLLLGKPSLDFDLVVEGDAIRLARALARKYGGRVSSHRRFGTAKWRLDPQDERLRSALGLEQEQLADLPATLDLVSARTEFYMHPTALPTVQQGSIKLDLHRRDFSINTLALRLDGRYYGKLLDHWGGGKDLREGVIRVLHSLSFIDDPTRMLRAVRLEQRLGFTIEPRTLELLHDALPLLGRVSGERVRGELEQIFKEPRRLQIMDRLQELDLLRAIHPALRWGDWQRQAFAQVEGFRPPESWRLAGEVEPQALYYGMLLVALEPAQAQAVCRRLHFAAQLRADLLQANRLYHGFPARCGEGRPSALVEYLEGFRERALVIAWLAFFDQPDCRARLERYLRQWRFVTPTTTGDTLRAMGLPPGPAYGRILHRLRAARLDGEVTSDEQEQALLEALLEGERGA